MKKLSYANVVSTICLFLILGGGAYAASQLPKNSVGTEQLKKGAVTEAKISKGAQAALDGTEGPKGDQGPPGVPGLTGAPGAPATTMYAQVKGDGTINASGSPVTVNHLAIGNYLVNFGRDVTHCATFVQQGPVPDFATAGGATGLVAGYAPLAAIFSPVPYDEEPPNLPPGFPLSRTVHVFTYQGSAVSDSSFYVAVLC